MPHRERKEETLQLDEEKLRDIGRIIGQAIAEELINHGIFSRDFYQPGDGMKIRNDFSVSSLDKKDVPKIDSSLIDVGVSAEGIEAKFDSLTSEEVIKDDNLSDQKEKLKSMMKKRSGT